MSNLLERAIIDAKALKEAALKNAEQLVIEKYSLEVKEAMDHLLEQEADAGLDLFGDDAGTEDPTETTIEEPTTEEGEEQSISPEDIQSELPDAFMEDEDEVITIKLDSLEDDLDFEDDEEGLFGGDDELSDDEIGIDIEDDDIEADLDFDTDLGADADMGADVGVDIAPATLEEMIADALQDVLSEDEELEEEVNEQEELDEEIDLDDLMERVRVEGEPQKSGWAGTPESIMKEYEAMLLAREQDSEVKEENEEQERLERQNR